MVKILKYKGLDIDPSKLNETVSVKNISAGGISLQESTSGESYVMPRIEAIHSGATANNVYYPADKLKGNKDLQSGVYSWTKPYGKPVIYNHDLQTEVTGRIERAAYSEYTEAGKPGIILVPKISEPNAVQAVRDGRLLTVSIGASTNHAICSICGTDIINEGYCGHMKGEKYDEEIAHWIVGDIFFNELSWVNQPADSNAFVVDSDVSKEIVVRDTEEDLHDKDLNEYYGIPKKIQIVESVANNNKKEDLDNVGKKPNKTLEALQEATKNAKILLEALNVSFQPITVAPGESVVAVNDGEEIPANASVSIDSEVLSVELNDDQNIVITASENAEDQQADVNLTITAGEETTTTNLEVVIEVSEGSEEPEEPEEPETGTEEGGDPVDPEQEEPEDPQTTPEDPVEPTDPEGTEDPVDPETPTESNKDDESGNQEEPEGQKEPEDLEKTVLPEVEDKETTDESNIDDTIEEAAKIIESLKASNDMFRIQVNELNKKLKESYIEQIVIKYDGNLSEEYIDKLKGRKLESLTETLEDLNEGYLNLSQAEIEKKTDKRKVERVNNPIQENEKDKTKVKEVTNDDKVSFIKKMFL